MTDPQTPMLKVVEGPETGNSLSLSGRTRVVIGRRVNTDLQILDPGISGKHCEVCADDAGYIVRDLGSSNGTFLNGRQIEKETLRDSDVIHVGHSAIQYLATGVGLTDSQPIPVDAVLVEDRWQQGDSDIIERYSATGSFHKLLQQQQQAPSQLKRALTSIYQIAIVLQEGSPLNDRLFKILSLILESYQADRGCVVLTVGSSSNCEIAASVDNRGCSEPFEVSQTILGRTLEKGQSILTLDLPASEVFDSSQSLGEQRVKSVICVPISSQSQQLGALYFDSLSRVGAFDRDDLQLLTCVARLVGELIEKDQLSREAEATRERLRVVLEEAPVGVFSLDQSLTFIVWTGHLTRLLGYSPEDVRDHGLELMMADPSRVEMVLDQTEEKGSYEGELLCRRKDGSQFRGRLALARIYAPGTENLKVIGCLTDISVREKLRRELMEQQKLASLGLLIAGITHDLKNFLTSLYGTAQLAEQFPRYQEQLVGSALTTARSSVTLIETLLGIVRGADEWEQMDLNTVVETTLSLIETQLRHDEIEVIRELSDVPPMHARKSFIQDMLLNLILNARKAMSEGGELRIAVCSSSADSVRMEVSDSGVGIEAEKLPHIFDPFFTQQKGSGGTGLGLYMVQHIVEEHGGQIEVRSEIGRGTTFEIELPTRSERAAGEGSVTAVDDSAETQQFALMRQLQVLVGEMDGDTIAQFRQAVDGGSWDLAGDSATMLEMARSSRYDVMFLSTQLPGEPGVRELYEEMVQLSQGPVYLVHEGQELPDGLPSSDTLLRRPLQVEDLCILLEGLAKTGEST